MIVIYLTLQSLFTKHVYQNYLFSLKYVVEKDYYKISTHKWPFDEKQDDDDDARSFTKLITMGRLSFQCENVGREVSPKGIRLPRLGSDQLNIFTSIANWTYVTAIPCIVPI